jgi:hypothetical protein
VSGLARYNPDLGAQELTELWTVDLGGNRLRCSVCTHPDGWKLRLEERYEDPEVRVCKDEAEVYRLAEEWRGKLSQPPAPIKWRSVLKGTAVLLALMSVFAVTSVLPFGRPNQSGGLRIATALAALALLAAVSTAKVLELPDDFVGNVQKSLNTPPPPKKAKRKKATKRAPR